MLSFALPMGAVTAAPATKISATVRSPRTRMGRIAGVSRIKKDMGATKPGKSPVTLTSLSPFDVAEETLTLTITTASDADFAATAMANCTGVDCKVTLISRSKVREFLNTCRLDPGGSCNGFRSAKVAFRSVLSSWTGHATNRAASGSKKTSLGAVRQDKPTLNQPMKSVRPLS